MKARKSTLKSYIIYWKKINPFHLLHNVVLTNYNFDTGKKTAPKRPKYVASSRLITIEIIEPQKAKHKTHTQNQKS